MAVGFAVGTANSILNSLARATAWTPPAACYIQLHVGDPGAAGTANVAAETDRVQGTFGSAASGGAISNTAALTWTAVAGAEDYTHYSAWSASTSGTFLFSGTVTANAVAIGDNFTIPIGDLDLAIPVAS
jgi:hypothetical protein